MIDSGTDGTLIVKVQNGNDLFEALDALHTQVLDHIPEEEQPVLLRVLEKAMNDVCWITNLAEGRRMR